MRRHTVPRAALALLGAAGAAIVFSGCAAPAASKAELPPKNEAKLALPLDQFSYAQRAHLRDYAEALVEEPCYAEHGIDWPVPWQPAEQDLGASVSAGGAVIFNTDLAGKYGYHHAPVTYDNSAAWRKFVEITNATNPPGFDRIMRECQAVSRKALPLPSQDAIDYATVAAAQIYDEALLSSDVAQKAAAWAACMSKAGYGGMAATPDGMPPTDKTDAWQVAVPFTTAGAEELAVAAADAKCRTVSGWSSALYAEEWDRQADFVRKNASKLLRIRAELADEKKTLLEAVAQNAPARP